MEQRSDIRLPVIVPPTANDRVDYRDHVSQRHRRSSLRQVADLIPEPGHRLCARHGVEVVRIGMVGPPSAGQPQTFSAFDLIAKELEPVIDMHDPGDVMMWRVTGLARKDTAPESVTKIFLKTVIRITARAEGPCLLLALGGSEVNGACHGKTKVALVALD